MEDGSLISSVALRTYKIRLKLVLEFICKKNVKTAKRSVFKIDHSGNSSLIKVQPLEHDNETATTLQKAQSILTRSIKNCDS